MTTCAQILIYAIPFFLLLIGIEWIFSKSKSKQVFRTFDTVSSLSSGITNSVKDVLGLSIIIISYTWLYNHLQVFSISQSCLLYVVAFIVLDFAGYWSHRFEHKINVLWNRHIIHHSSEEFNLACALRQPISSIFALFTILLLPAAILGVAPEVIATVAPLHLFAQFWYHTRLINKMGWLEHILVTPSHHRVHHAINDRYIDKNFSQVFIVWDKWFGTFQEELDEEPPVYGVKIQLSTWNPILINWKHFGQLCLDAWHTRSFTDKIKIWFMPTGWRPKDVEKLYPIDTITNARTLQKYSSHPSIIFRTWATIQLIITLVMTLHFLTIIDQYPLVLLCAYGFFIILNIYAYTSLMDRNSVAFISEILKYLTITAVYWVSGSWYGVSLQIILLFNSLSLLFCFYFLYLEKDTDLPRFTSN